MHITILALLAGCSTEPAPFAQAFVMEDLADGIGGPKALAIAGDFILENDRLRLAITNNRYSTGPGLYGGSVIDADLNRAGGRFAGADGNDRFAELFPTVNMNVALTEAEGSVFILNDGADGDPAIVRATSESTPFLRLLAPLWGIVGMPDFNMATDYELAPGQPWVTMRTTVFLGDPDDVPDESELLPGGDELPLIDWAIESGFAFGDFFLQGGDIDVFAPGIGFDENGAVADKIALGENTFQEPFVLDFVGGAGDGVSYGLATLDGPLHVPLFTSSQTAGFGAGRAGDPDSGDRIADGEALTYERILVIGDGDIGSVMDAIYEARGTPTGTVSGFVLGQGSLEGVPGAHIFVFEPGAEGPTSQWESDVSWDDVTEDGSFGGQLPVGDWELAVKEPGLPMGERLAISVSEGESLDLTLLAARPGQVQLRVVDETGLQVPSKVTIFGADGATIRDPVLGDGFIGGQPDAVVFMPWGQEEIVLPPGDYVAWATRGPEYELGMAEFSVSAGFTADIELQVQRSVDTEGCISADFHVHSQSSHDSGVSWRQRVGTMVSEQVEFMVSSDHDFVTDYRPVIEDMDLEPWISADVGTEVTTVEVGHFIGFPLEPDYLSPNGGAFDWTDSRPSQMLAGIVDLAQSDIEPVTFIAHPRDGILGYFDQFGFSPYGGDIGDPLVTTPTLSISNDLLDAGNFTLEVDAIEVLNGKRFDFPRTPTQIELDDYAADRDSVRPYDINVRTMAEQEDLEDGVFRLGYGRHGQIDDWFSLLNLGYRLTALGNSDTHGTSSTEAGCPRNYVASDTDDPAYIRTEDIAAMVAQGRVFTTYGPFIRFTIDDTAQMGDDYVSDGELSIYAEVQSPSWFNVDRVELYRNGTLIHEWEIDSPNADVLNLAETFLDDPDQDSWYVLIALGDDDLSPLFTPVEIEPVELTEVVIGALESVGSISSFLSEAVPIPRTNPVYPFALSNPIYVDRDGDGWDAPGLPDWLETPEPPVEEE